MFNNAYEVLDYLSKQCGIFEPIKKEFEYLKNENTELKDKIDNGNKTILTLMSKVAQLEKQTGGAK